MALPPNMQLNMNMGGVQPLVQQQQMGNMQQGMMNPMTPNMGLSLPAQSPIHQPQPMQSVTPLPLQQLQQQQQMGMQGQAPMMSMPPQQQLQPPPQQAQQQPKEMNAASVCRFGQEMVQDIVSRTQEVFQLLKSVQPPNWPTSANPGVSPDKKAKAQEQLKNIRLHFKRLRVFYEKIREYTAEYDNIDHERELVPYLNDKDNKLEEKKNSEVYQANLEERKELYEQLVLKNRHIQEIMDYMRGIVWEINTMLAMRRP